MASNIDLLDGLSELNKPENIEYLELGEIPSDVFNPLLDYPLDRPPEDPVEDMVQTLMNQEYLHFAAKVLLGVDLLPFQVVILETLWNKRFPMLIASRGAGKSFILAVYALLRMIFHPGCKIVIVGAAFRQSRAVMDYAINIWEKSPILKDIGGKNGGPRREVDRVELRIGDSLFTAIPLGDGSKIRGMRANYILCDEYASIPQEIFATVVQGFGVVSSSPVEKVKKAMINKKLKALGEWSDEIKALTKAGIKGNQIVYSGTAYYAFNHFYIQFKKWHTIISSKGEMKKLSTVFANEDKSEIEGFDWKDYAILRIPYTYLPEGYLDAGIVSQAKANLHTGQFLMEYCGIFQADSDGFYKRSIIEAATTNKPIMTQSGRNVQFSASRTGDAERIYIMGVDPAADQDNAAIVLLELYQDHRRVVNCWTTNRKKYNAFKAYMKQLGIALEDDYYKYIAKKIRGLMRTFNIERIMMDKNGGGTAIAEALASQYTCEEGEFPVYEIVDPEKPKPSDIEEGIHILELIAPNAEINAEANHGMLKDLQDKILLFPMFDTIELEKAIKLDEVNNIKFDTYEDLVEEIEELKNEMTTIVVTPSSTLGKETFDTPTIKLEGSKKGHLRKDRYSALLYANYYSRNKDKSTVFKVQYKAVGGTRETIGKVKAGENRSMYRGHGLAKFDANGKNWIKNNGARFIKRNQ
jgi:hypothetical protein